MPDSRQSARSLRGRPSLTPWVWHADLLRKHVANRCPTCHPTDCFLCVQAALLPPKETP